jgi:hypothetical protein
MSAIIDMTGKRFGRLIVIERAENRTNRKVAMWKCKCDCGKEVVCRGTHIRSGRTSSCGCLGIENATKAKLKHGDAQGKHARLYGVWCNMKNRCYHKKNKSYKNYGARGIRVCAEWFNDYSAFKEWCYSNGYDDTAEYQQCTIDRIDNDGDSSPSNCRFSTAKEQAANKRRRKAKSVEQYALSGEYITTWPGCSFIERVTRRYRSKPIQSACSGIRKTAYGYVWKYANG